MKLKKVKKSWLYLFCFLIGIVLIITAIVMFFLKKEKGDSNIFIDIVLLSLWTIFTLTNLSLYKKERRKEKTV